MPLTKLLRTRRTGPVCSTESTRDRISSTSRISPCSNRLAPIRLILAPESSEARRVSARKLPRAMASSLSVIPASPVEAVARSRQDVERVLAEILDRLPAPG